MLSRISHSTPLALALLLLVLTLLVDVFGSNGLARTATEILIRVVMVVGMWIFIGNSGVISFGHTAFMCIGAYAAAWFTVPPMMKQLFLPGLPDYVLQNSWPFLPSALVAIVFASLIAVFIGLVIMRLSGIAASIATFAMLAIVNVVYSNWESVTAATSSVVGIPMYATLWLTLVSAIICIIVAWLYAQSRFGLALRAAREEPIGAQASGIDIFRQRLLAFVISAAVVAYSGVLQAHYIGVVNPGAFYLSITFTALAMLVVGGMHSLSGAVLGVLVITVMIELFVRFEDGITVAGVAVQLPSGIQEIAVGLLMILILVKRPAGLTNNREIALRSMFSDRFNKSLKNK